MSRFPVLVRPGIRPLMAMAVTSLGLACTACAAGANPGAAPGVAASEPQTTASAAASAIQAPTSPASPATPATTPTAAGQGAKNLMAGNKLKATLLAAYAAVKKLPENEVTGPLKGTLYYGTDDAGTTYWAVAEFGLTSSASFNAQVSMQDGGNTGVFSRQAGQPWTVRLGSFPFPCPGELPADLMSVWGMTYPGGCMALTATSPQKAQASYANTDNMPAGTYFGVVLYEQLQVNGYGDIDFEPETWQGTASPASRRHVYYDLSINSSTVTGYWKGTSRSSSREVPGSFDLAFARRIKKAMVPFTTQPTSGYEVTVTIPRRCSGACSEVAKIVQFSAAAPLPANPDFAEPS